MDPRVGDHVAKFEAAERAIVGVREFGHDQFGHDQLGDVATTRVGVIVASGPFGPEVVAQPLGDGDAVPAEFHVWLPGALRSAAEYGVGRLGYLDAGIRASGKVGYVLTADALHIGVTGDEQTVAFTDIRSVHFDDGRLHLETGLSDMTQPDVYEIGAQLTAALHDVLALR
jgi:hypothetical protein